MRKLLRYLIQKRLNGACGRSCRLDTKLTRKDQVPFNLKWIDSCVNSNRFGQLFWKPEGNVPTNDHNKLTT